MLTAEQVDRYRHDGYLFPFPALSSDEIAECREGLQRFEGWRLYQHVFHQRAGLAGVSGVAPTPDRPSGTRATSRQFD
jgi:hypothetical protein